jgi:hypothetical protein
MLLSRSGPLALDQKDKGIPSTIGSQSTDKRNTDTEFLQLLHLSTSIFPYL